MCQENEELRALEDELKVIQKVFQNKINVLFCKTAAVYVGMVIAAVLIIAIARNI